MKKLTASALILALLLALALPCFAADTDRILAQTAELVYASTPQPQVASVGGDWAVFGMLRAGKTLPASYLDSYYKAVETALKNSGGILSPRKYTEFSRVVLALTAMGKDPSNVAGYDLLLPLTDFDKTVLQGTNGAVYALLAFDAGSYEIPMNPDAKTQATRQMYIDHILSREVPGGGWSIGTANAEADVTAMVLQAFAAYQDQPAVKAATQRGIAWLSANQTKTGGFTTMSQETCESVSQLIIALCTLGVDLSDSRFVKNGHSVMDNLMGFFVSGKGFAHTAGGEADAYATEQALLALAAVQRAANGESSLYSVSDGTKPAFADIAGHKNQAAIEALAAEGIINGMGNGTFAPNKTMTRAEFCAITVRALGLTLEKTDAFTDVAGDKWYAEYVGAAYQAEIVNGVGNGRFNPEGTISWQEAVTMIARSARVLGLDTTVETPETYLRLLPDPNAVADYAKEAMAFCLAEKLTENGAAIMPKSPILRCEIAQILYNLLILAEKL